MRLLALLTLVAASTACDAAAPVVVEPPCVLSTRPLVAVHGFLASGDTWSPMAQRFASNGQCFERVRAFDWDSLAGSGEDAIRRLDAFIDRVRTETGAAQVDLIGHSAGGGLAYDYLASAEHAAKVARYVHVASFLRDGPAGPVDAPVPTLNLWSDGDRVVREKGDISGATNRMLQGQDHYAVATSAESFLAVATFLDGQAAAVSGITPTPSARLSGKALQLGSNATVTGRVEIYELDGAGQRTGAAVAIHRIGADGAWGPHHGRPGVAYELVVVQDDPEQLPIHYFREPLARTNDLIYLRTLPPATSLAGALLSSLKYDDGHVIAIVFSASRALLAGTDTLEVGGTVLPLDAVATPEKSAIALFLDDGNLNGASDLSPLSGLAGFPFLGGLDLFLPTSPERVVDFRLNGRTLRVRNWRSATDGPVVAVFD